MDRTLRSWIPALLFWSLFAACVGLARRYLWPDSIWYAVGMLFVLALSAYSLIYALRHRDETGCFSSKAIPRWLERWLMDEETPEQSRIGNKAHRW